MRRAFALVELLVVVGILAVLAAILLPVFLRVREAGRRTSCLANLRSLGTAATLYLTDADDRVPDGKFGNARYTFTVGIGWAGKIAPYAGSPALFACPSDGRELPRPGLTLPGSRKVSYGLNYNLIGEGASAATAPARTVLLFEVSGGRALLSATDEGASIAPGTYRLMSPEGTGTFGSLLESSMPYPGPLPARFTLYATGLLDNHEREDASDDFDAPRHGDGANLLALDGHVAWTPPKAVSAGLTAPEPNAGQSRTGCASFGSRHKVEPCAEGTALARHRLTFSHR